MTAIQLQRAIVDDLRNVFKGVMYKSTDISSEEDIEALRPPGDMETWTDYQKEFWSGVQHDYRQHALKPLNVYAQQIPYRETSSPGPPEDDDFEMPPQDYDSEPDPFPYIIVRLVQGKIETPSAAQVVTLLVLVGMYDDNPNNVGHMSVMDVIDRIQMHYREYPVLEQFQYMDPFEWYLQDEESYPYFYGACTLTFWAKSPVTEQWEDLV